MKKTNIVSIDLKTFFGSLLEQWKCVLLFSVVMAFLISGTISLKTNSEAREEAELYKELSLMSDEEKLNTLPELDRVRVALALKDRSLIEQQEKYYENSIVDPMLEAGRITVLRMRWVVTKNKNISALNAAYCAYLTSDEIIPVVRDSLGPEYSGLDDIYIRELISADPSDAIELSIIIPEGTEAEKLKINIDRSLLEAYPAFMLDFESHTVTYASSDVIIVTDDSRVASKAVRDAEYKDLKEEYTALLLEFDYKENVVFDSIVDPDESRTVYNDPGIRFTPKTLLSGFAVGLIVYVFIYLVYIVMSPKVHDSSVIAEMLGIRAFGTISKYNYKGFASVVHGKKIYNMLRKKSVDGASLENICDSIAGALKQKGTGKVLIVSPGFAKEYSEEANQLTDKIRRTSGIDIRCADNISNEKDLNGIDAVILFVTAKSTDYSELMNIAGICDSCGKLMIGGVYLD